MSRDLAGPSKYGALEEGERAPGCREVEKLLEKLLGEETQKCCGEHGCQQHLTLYKSDSQSGFIAGDSLH